MNEEHLRETFVRNLKFYIDVNGKTQKEIAKAIGVSPQTFNTWYQGIALPRMEKVEKLADYFGIGKTELLVERASTAEEFNAETAMLLTRIKTNATLMQLCRDYLLLSPEQQASVANLVQSMLPDKRP